MEQWWGRWQKDLAPAGLPWEICGVYASLGPEEREKERVEKLVEELVYRRLQAHVFMPLHALLYRLLELAVPPAASLHLRRRLQHLQCLVTGCVHSSAFHPDLPARIGAQVVGNFL